ncbi:MAG: citrate synthase [Spirochaetota bacterium]
MESVSEKAMLEYGGKKAELPVVMGSDGQVGIDIGKLKSATGFLTYDNGFANTGSCLSDITFVDGDAGVLRYRGYDIADLAESCTFVEVAYLLVHGKLPNSLELAAWSSLLNEHSMVHEDMRTFFTEYPPNSHPMAILSAMVTSLSSFYPHIMEGDPNFDITAARLISKVRTIAAFSYKKSLGEPVVYPRHDLPYCRNFLNMMFSSPVRDYETIPEVVDALNKLLILHADHEQNCSTSTVRMVASSGANLYAAISSGISALWGPMHGGANQAVIEMLEAIRMDGGGVRKYIEKAKSKTDRFRLMGFGHAVYKSYDPRARITKRLCDSLLPRLHLADPLLDIALELERAALADDYFVERRLYPNVDFYSGILYRAMGIPINMLTVMFAIGRLPGWIAHWHETAENPEWKIWRPRQIYIGPTKRDFVAIDNRA